MEAFQTDAFQNDAFQVFLGIVTLTLAIAQSPGSAALASGRSASTGISQNAGATSVRADGKTIAIRSVQNATVTINPTD